MNSRKRMIRAVSFEHPDRIPLRPSVTAQHWLSHSDAECEALRAYLNSLPLDCGPFPPLDKETLRRRRRQGKRVWTDSWGCRWEESIPGEFGTVVEHPLADWDNVAHYTFPDDLPTFKPAPGPRPDEPYYLMPSGADA